MLFDYIYKVLSFLCFSMCFGCNYVVINSNEEILCFSMLLMKDSGLCSECVCLFDYESLMSRSCS